MMAICRQIILAFLMLISFKGNAHYYKQYNTGNGFISNHIYHIVQDSKGYFWICTNKGVVKYNGQSFEKFTTSNGLTDNDVFRCYEDMSGRIWFFTYNGKYCYYRNDTIFNSHNDSLLKKLPVRSYINAMYSDVADSSLYIGHVEGTILKIRNNVIKETGISIQKTNKLRHFYCENGKMKILTLYGDFEFNNGKPGNYQETEVRDPYINGGKLMITDDEGVKLYQDGKLLWQCRDKDVSVANTYHLFYDGNNHILCGTRYGLIVYNIITNTKQQFFKNIRITCSLKDYHGNYWVSSFGEGIFRLNKEQLYNSRLLSNTEGYDLIFSKADQVFLKKENEIKALVQEGNALRFKTISVKTNALFEPVFLTDSFFRYYRMSDGMSFEVNLITGTQKSYNENFLVKCFKGTNNNVFTLTSAVELRTIKITGNRHEILDSFTVSHRIHSEHYIPQTNSIYFFSNNLFYKYSLTDLKLQLIDTINNIGGNNNIFYENGRILLLLNNNELVVYYGNDKPKKIADVSLTNPVYSIKKIVAGKYIINTDNGYELLEITQAPFFIKTRQIVYPFDQNDILSINSFNGYIICKINNELYSFPHQSLNQDIPKSKLYIKKVILNDSKIPENIYEVTANNRTDIKVVLSPVYFNNDALTYRYRINENDETGSWHSSKTNELNFLINNSGKYQLQLQALSSAYAFSNIETIQLNIKPTFFSSTPFYLLCSVFGISIFGLAFRYNNKRKRALFNNEMNYLQLEHKAVNSLLNPHFVFNAINNIQNLVNIGSKEEANEYLATLSIMIRQNIENLQFSLVPLQKELQLIQNYIELQNLRFKDRIAYSLENTADTNIYIPPLLIHTFVENAIVHGFDKSTDDFCVRVATSVTADDYLVISITDNGVGLKQSGKKATAENKISLGISFTEKRLKRLSEFYKVHYSLDIKDLSECGGGTEVTIIIYAHFRELMEKQELLYTRL